MDIVIPQNFPYLIHTIHLTFDLSIHLHIHSHICSHIHPFASLIQGTVFMVQAFDNSYYGVLENLTCGILVLRLISI